jgi:hypothetical protein
VWLIFTDVSEKSSASIFRVEEYTDGMDIGRGSTGFEALSEPIGLRGTVKKY